MKCVICGDETEDTTSGCCSEDCLARYSGYHPAYNHKGELLQEWARDINEERKSKLLDK